MTSRFVLAHNFVAGLSRATKSLRPDIQAQTGYARSDWTATDQRSQIRPGGHPKQRPNSYRPDIQAQSVPDLTAPDRKESHRAAKSRQDMPASGRASRHPSKDRTASIEPPIPDESDNTQTCHDRPTPSDETSKLRLHSLSQDIQCQIGHPTSDSERTS